MPKTYARSHNDAKREQYTPFVIFSYDPVHSFEKVCLDVNMLCSDGINIPRTEALPVTGTWEGKEEPGVLVFIQGLTEEDSLRIFQGVCEAAFLLHNQKSVLAVAANRIANVISCVDIDSDPETFKVKSEYIGRWESVGSVAPVDEDWTKVRDTYYVCRKYKGE